MFKRIIYFIMVALSLCFPTTAMEDLKNKNEVAIKRQDPPFFLLQENKGRPIYILGSQHYIPLDNLFSEKVIAELHRIADQKVILYTEHEVSNEKTLQCLETQKKYESGDLLKWVENKTDFSDFPKITDINNSKYCREELKTQKVLLKLIDGTAIKVSETSLEEVFNKAPLWLGAVILGTHSGIMSYNKFGGPELDLINGKEWQEKWSEINYLEGLSDVLEIMQKNSKQDAPHNIDWIKKSLQKIVGFNTKNESFYEKLKKDMTEGIEAFSWNCITISSEKAPKSAFARNQLWVNVIEEKLKTSEAPILIAVGNGHLLGIDEGFSLIGLLMARLGISKLYRYTNNGEWILSCDMGD